MTYFSNSICQLQLDIFRQIRFMILKWFTWYELSVYFCINYSLVGNFHYFVENILKKDSSIVSFKLVGRVLLESTNELSEYRLCFLS